MSATRPVILAALKTLLINGVTAVAGKVYLPWDNPPETSSAPFLEIITQDSTIDQEIIGVWTHTIPIKIGCVQTGKFDYPTVWDILDTVASTIEASRTLSGSAVSINITGDEDSITTNNDRILWPHLTADIIYRTTKGHI